MTTNKGTRTSAASVWRLVGRSAGVKILVLPISAILGIVITRILIQNYGQATYGQYALLVTIGSLLPFVDLGIGAAVMNAIGGSTDPHNDEHVRRVLVTSLRILACSAAVLVLTAVVLSLADLWEPILGAGLVPGSGPLAASLCLGVIAITVPFGIGQRIMTGSGKNHWTILVLGLQSPIVVLTLLILVNTGVSAGAFIAVVSYSATLLLSVVISVIAGRTIAPSLWVALRAVPKLRTERGGPVIGLAWPMLVQMIALPVAMQTDRIVLSHVADLSDLTEYSLASQMFTPVWAVIAAAGVTLWPVFARSRGGGSTDAVSPYRVSIGFAGAAALLCGAIAVASPLLARVASDGLITIGLPLLFAFTGFMILQGLKYPLGMYMTDARGLRFQAFMILLMVPVNLGLSIALAKSLGAVGPVIGSLIGVAVFQVLANFLYVRRDLRRAAERRAQPPAEQT